MIIKQKGLDKMVLNLHHIAEFLLHIEGILEFAKERSFESFLLEFDFDGQICFIKVIFKCLVRIEEKLG